METKEELHKQLKRLEQENAELKEKISKNKAEEIGKETYLELKIKKYKQALEEIREICTRSKEAKMKCAECLRWIIVR